MSIYTRAGDKGETSLKTGKKILKSDIRLDAFGSVDELNSSLGILIVGLKEKKIKGELLKIQKDLFEIGGQLASSSTNKKLDLFLNKRVSDFENLIDSWSKEMPVLKHFILPGGSKNAALVHLARTICRRAERRTVELSHKEKVDGNVIVYLNRLSDLLFTMARFVNKIEKQKEIIWDGGKR
jgi:cob(I)alamin adenosyltransferase